MAGRARTEQGDTADRLAWRHYGRTAGITEQILDANPGLCDHGPILPQGLPVELPDPAPAPDPASIHLWD